MTFSGGVLDAQGQVSGQPLDRFLNPDGTLNLSSGFNGSLDAQGWRMSLSENGTPQFSRIGGDEYWDDRFGPPGTNGIVYSLAINGDDIYIGGRFTLAGTILANNIARWNSRTKLWSDVGGGLASTVYALAVNGDEVYAGGTFMRNDANGYVARWNPSLTTWDILGDSGIVATIDPVQGLPDGMPGAYVYALAVVGDDLYIGGDFDKADDIQSENLVRWNRSTDKFGAVGAVGVVRAMAYDGKKLYVGGTLAGVAGTTVNNIAEYDVAKKVWAPMGSGLNDTVFSIAAYGAGIYAGGAFTKSGSSTTINHIGRFDTTAKVWSELGGGSSLPVYALRVIGNDLYVGSGNTRLGSTAANGIARWNGSAWSTLSIGVGDKTAPAVYAINGDSNAIYAGGRFSTAGVFTAHNIAGWGKNTWFQLGRNALKDVNQNGTSSGVFAIAVNGNDVYLGGDFTKVGNIQASYIARWNRASNTWYSLGSGIGGTAPFVRAIGISGSSVYVGGSFSSAGGVAANGIARWDGTSWSAVGGGVGGATPYIFAINVNGTNVYVGGAFTTAGGQPASRVARYDGSAWSALGSGIGDATTYSSVNAIAVIGTNVYVGGDFTLAGGAVANRIARYNGSAWSALGIGVNAPVAAMAVIGDTLFAGGEFTLAGGAAANYVAKWNGSAWSAVGVGFNGPVRALAASGNQLYAGGEFTLSGSNSAGRIARFNGSNWSALRIDSADNGVNGPVRSIGIGPSSTIVGGEFSIAGGLRANNVAEFDGKFWSSLGTDPTAGLEGPVLALALKDTNVYVGGAFASAGGMKTNGVARWDGNNWARMGLGVNGIVRAIALVGNDVYVGGEFDTAGTTYAPGIARWDGDAWNALGSGVGGPQPYVYALNANGSTLFVGGAFATAGGVSARRIAQYNTASKTWSAVGSGVGGAPFFTYVTALASRGNDLYVGGVFPSMGSVIVNNIARWSTENQTWSALGGGINDAVYAVAVDDNNRVYVGGSFSVAGNIPANNIALWDGTKWDSLGGGFNGDVNTIAFYDNEAFAGGSFTTAGVAYVNHVGRWNGVEWVSMGGGVDKDRVVGRAMALASYPDGVYVGGDFTVAGGHPSLYFAHWRRTPFLGVKTQRVSQHASFDLRSYPNPTSSTTTIAFTLSHAGQTTLEVYTLQGERIATLVDDRLDAGEHIAQWNASNIAAGAYVYRVRCGGDHESGVVQVVR